MLDAKTLNLSFLFLAKNISVRKNHVWPADGLSKNLFLEGELFIGSWRMVRRFHQSQSPTAKGDDSAIRCHVARSTVGEMAPFPNQLTGHQVEAANFLVGRVDMILVENR